MRIHSLSGLGLLAVLASMVPVSVFATDVAVGEVSFRRGLVVASRPQAPDRALEVADEVAQGDRLTSGPRSFSVIEFLDASRLAIRPNSEVHIAEYLRNAGSALLELDEGGLQATIRPGGGSAQRRVYRFDAGAVELDVEDARFDLRHCGAECAEEGRQILRSHGALPDGAIGRVTLVRGALEVTGEAGEQRKLRMSDPLFAGDVIRSGPESHAMLIFSDGGRMTVDRDSTVRLGDIRLDGGAGDRFEAELVTGGLRVLTGLLGKRDPDALTYRAPVATTGVRGTGFDLLCQGSCQFPDYAGIDPMTIRDAWPDGLYTGVWDGRVVVRNEAGMAEVPAGGYSYVPNAATAPVVLPDRPRVLDGFMAPRPPRGEPADDRTHQARLWFPQPGTWLYVHDGEVTLHDQRGDEPPVRIRGNRYVYVPQQGEIAQGEGAPPFLYFDAACPRCGER